MSFQQKTPSQSPPGGIPPGPQGALGLWDAVSIIVGIVVGSSIFQVAPLILMLSGTAGMGLLLWGVGGLVSFIGALVYAELATAYPRDGGDYVYLSRAFGSWLGFLFGWAQLAVILTSSIALMAFTFANYAGRFHPAFRGNEAVMAVSAVVVFTALNLIGVVFGKTVQNVLTVVKVLGLLAILAAGFLYRNPDASWGPLWPETMPPLQDLFLGGPAVSLILILYAYGGWNDAAFVAAEVRDVKKNLTRALFIGLAIITVLYVLVNAAYINALGFAAASDPGSQVAADVLKLPLGEFGERAMALLVMLSALGAVNGIIFAGSRVYSTLGKDHALFGWMGRWSNARGTPTAALIVQALFCVGMILVVGTARGQQLVNQLFDPLLQKWGLAVADTWKPMDGFEYLFACSAPVFWVFFGLTGVSLFVLRVREPHVDRPFRVPLYPIIPAIFVLSCAFWVYRSLEFAIVTKKATGGFLLIGLFPLVVGVPLYGLSKLLEKKAPSV